MAYKRTIMKSKVLSLVCRTSYEALFLSSATSSPRRGFRCWGEMILRPVPSSRNLRRTHGGSFRCVLSLSSRTWMHAERKCCCVANYQSTLESVVLTSTVGVISGEWRSCPYWCPELKHCWGGGQTILGRSLPSTGRTQSSEGLGKKRRSSAGPISMKKKFSDVRPSAADTSFNAPLEKDFFRSGARRCGRGRRHAPVFQGDIKNL